MSNYNLEIVEWLRKTADLCLDDYDSDGRKIRTTPLERAEEEAQNAPAGSKVYFTGKPIRYKALEPDIGHGRSATDEAATKEFLTAKLTGDKGRLVDEGLAICLAPTPPPLLKQQKYGVPCSSTGKARASSGRKSSYMSPKKVVSRNDLLRSRLALPMEGGKDRWSFKLHTAEKSVDEKIKKIR